MPDVKENYKWEAERSDGQVIVKGGDLTDCVRFSLIPIPMSRLPRHDFVGIPLVKRFCRGFQKVRFAGKKPMPGLIFWVDGAKVLKTSEDLTEHLGSGDYIGKGVAGEDWYQVFSVTNDTITLLAPYRGNTKKNGMPGRRMDSDALKPSEQYVHCVETKTNRTWINYATGTVLVTPREYELYL